MRTLGATIALAFVAAFAIVGCTIEIGGDTLTGSGQLSTQSYDYADFTDVDVSDAFDVEITSAEDHVVEVTVDDNIVENLDVRLDGDTLRIGMKGLDSYRNVTLEAAVAMPALERLKLSGASEATLGSFSSGEPLKLEASGASSATCSEMASGSATFDLSGASRVDCRNLEAGDVSATLKGASKLELNGSGDNADIKAEGASQANLREFSVANAKVRLRGASRSTIDASGTLDADLADSSDLVYLGEPSLGDVKKTGGSTFERGD